MSRRPEGGAAAARAWPPPQAWLEPRPVAPPLGPREAAAQGRGVDVAQAPKTDSEELRRLTESENRRLGALQQWLARGCVGESNQGSLEARPGQAAPGEVAALIGAENRDRQAIVETFMRQNKMAPAEAGRVRASFAKAYRDRVQAGQWVQTDRGDWVKK